MWERVCSGTYRLRVESGWLYKILTEVADRDRAGSNVTHRQDVQIIFIPDSK